MKKNVEPAVKINKGLWKKYHEQDAVGWKFENGLRLRRKQEVVRAAYKNKYNITC